MPTLAQQINALDPSVISQYGAAALGGYLPGAPPGSTAQQIVAAANAPSFQSYNPGFVPGMQYPTGTAQGQGSTQRQPFRLPIANQAQLRAGRVMPQVAPPPSGGLTNTRPTGGQQPASQVPQTPASGGLPMVNNGLFRSGVSPGNLGPMGMIPYNAGGAMGNFFNQNFANNPNFLAMLRQMFAPGAGGLGGMGFGNMGGLQSILGPNLGAGSYSGQNQQ